jgi:hypothetical protein
MPVIAIPAIEFPAGEDPGWLVGPQLAAGEVFRPYKEEIARRTPSSRPRPWMRWRLIHG